MKDDGNTVDILVDRRTEGRATFSESFEQVLAAARSGSDGRGRRSTAPLHRSCSGICEDGGAHDPDDLLGEVFL
jgi:hypothetical protein